jgi:apolipoprotein D and lipocalin family protein
MPSAIWAPGTRSPSFPISSSGKCARDTSAEYSAGTGDELIVKNRCINADGGVEAVTGVARRVDAADPTRLKVRFAPARLAWLPVVWGDYWVIGLADDYRYAVVGEPSREYSLDPGA